MESTLTVYTTGTRGHTSRYCLWVTLRGYKMSDFKRVYDAHQKQVDENPSGGLWPIPLAPACEFIMEEYCGKIFKPDYEKYCRQILRPSYVINCNIIIRCVPRTPDDEKKQPPAIEELRRYGFLDWYTRRRNNALYKYVVEITEERTFETYLPVEVEFRDEDTLEFLVKQSKLSTREKFLKVHIYDLPLNIIDRSTTRVIPCLLASTLSASFRN